VSGVVDGRKVAVGNRALLEALGIDASPLLERADELRREGETAMFVAIDGALAGLLGLADPIKDSAAEAVRMLHAEGVGVRLLTEASRVTAEAVARKLGIDEIEADVLPEHKAESVERL